MLLQNKPNYVLWNLMNTKKHDLGKVLFDKNQRELFNLLTMVLTFLVNVRTSSRLFHT